MYNAYETGLGARVLSQRFEAKYVVSEVQALSIRDYIEPYVVADAHAECYPVTSLYLDSPDMRMYWSSELGESNRWKLRVRTYSDDAGAPLFFEVKQRIDRIIRKYRALVRRDCMERVLRGGEVGPDIMHAGDDGKGLANLYKFRDLMETMFATPRAGVRYEREAYVSTFEEPVRITFDRRLAALPSAGYAPEYWSSDAPWRLLEQFPVILEIKFTDAFPYWVRQLVWRFDLMRISLAKYVACVKTLNNAGLSVARPAWSEMAWKS